MNNTNEFLAEQKRLTEAATGGMWEACDMNEGMSPPRPLWGVVNEAYYNPPAEDDEEAGYVEVEIHVGDKADAEFIAAARPSVPKLIAAVEAVMAVRDLVSRPGDAPHVLSTIAGYNRAMTVVRASIEAALGGGGDGEN